MACFLLERLVSSTGLSKHPRLSSISSNILWAIRLNMRKFTELLLLLGCGLVLAISIVDSGVIGDYDYGDIFGLKMEPMPGSNHHHHYHVHKDVNKKPLLNANDCQPRNGTTTRPCSSRRPQTNDNSGKDDCWPKGKRNCSPSADKSDHGSIHLPKLCKDATKRPQLRDRSPTTAKLATKPYHFDEEYDYDYN